MHDNRMIPEVAPPGCWAIVKVSGSRIATPLAPPSPGNTPMITPRMIPASISITLNHDSATAKPPIRDWISSISIQPQCSFDRPLDQRHLEPDFEHQEEHRRHADADHRGLQPLVLAQPDHEYRDVDRRGDIDAQHRDQADIDDQ